MTAELSRKHGRWKKKKCRKIFATFVIVVWIVRLNIYYYFTVLQKRREFEFLQMSSYENLNSNKPNQNAKEAWRNMVKKCVDYNSMVPTPFQTTDDDLVTKIVACWWSTVSSMKPLQRGLLFESDCWRELLKIEWLLLPQPPSLLV